MLGRVLHLLLKEGELRSKVFPNYYLVFGGKRINRGG